MNIVFIQTPFHKKVFDKLFKNNIFNDDWLIFCKKCIYDDVINQYSKYKIITVEGLDMNFNLSLFKQISNCVSVKKRLLVYRDFLENLVLENDIKNLIFFSEKNVFVQLLLKKIKLSTTVWSVDEGVGHYQKPILTDYFRKAIYYLIMQNLIGFNYEYFRVLGTHSRINILLLRYPISRKKSLSLKIITFKDLNLLPNNNYFPKVSNNNNILLITSPYSECNLLNKDFEHEIYKSLIVFINSCHFKIEHKPHPIEAINEKYSELSNLKDYFIHNPSFASEDLDYNKYDFIINFGSSSIIDVASAGYPLKQIITVNILNKKFPDLDLFKETRFLTFGSNTFNLLRNIMVVKSNI